MPTSRSESAFGTPTKSSNRLVMGAKTPACRRVAGSGDIDAAT